MKINLVALITLLFCIQLFGANDYTAIDKRSVSIPDSLKTAEQISTYLASGLTTEKEKVRAFYIWISHNIDYDFYKINADKKYQTKTELVNDVLEMKQGVCRHFAELFHFFCQQSGIKSYAINGYARLSTGKISGASHVWNAVRIDSSYYNIDVTWASGYQTNNEYVKEFRDDFFLIEPRQFIKTHLPFDPVWQFLDNPIDIHDFNNENYSKLLTPGNYNYRALIAKIEKQDNLGYLEQANKRLIVSGEMNELTVREIYENAIQITFEKCRIAVDSLNSAIDNYNLYISHKNAKFHTPAIEDDKLKEILVTIERPLLKAEVMFQNLFTFNDDLNVQIVKFKKELQEFKLKLQIEKNFIDKFTKTKKSLRFLLFF